MQQSARRIAYREGSGIAQHKHARILQAGTGCLPDFYSILGVSERATAAEVSRAYRQMAKRLHPDKLGVSATEEDRQITEERFKQISEAADVLRDEERRSDYDTARRRKQPETFEQRQMQLAEAFVVWFDVVVKAVTSAPDGMTKAVQLISTLGIPAVLFYTAGPQGVKVGMHLISVLHGKSITQELESMTPAEQRAFMQAFEILDDNLP